MLDHYKYKICRLVCERSRTTATVDTLRDFHIDRWRVEERPHTRDFYFKRRRANFDRDCQSDERPAGGRAKFVSEFVHCLLLSIQEKSSSFAKRLRQKWEWERERERDGGRGGGSGAEVGSREQSARDARTDDDRRSNRPTPTHRFATMEYFVQLPPIMFYYYYYYCLYHPVAKEGYYEGREKDKQEGEKVKKNKTNKMKQIKIKKENAHQNRSGTKRLGPKM